MDPDVQREFERRDRISMWLGGAAFSVASIAFAIGGTACWKSVDAYAQVVQAERKNDEQDAAITRAQETREKVINIDARLTGIEGSVDEVKDEQRQQRKILEEIRARVGGPDATR